MQQIDPVVLAKKSQSKMHLLALAKSIARPLKDPLFFVHFQKSNGPQVQSPCPM